MTVLDIIRAWKDEDFRRALTAEQLSRLPAHPSGAIDFRDRSLEEAIGLIGNSPCHRCHSGP
jgi:mersacidin/lichenicidin family type 2 lantibiotic